MNNTAVGVGAGPGVSPAPFTQPGKQKGRTRRYGLLLIS